MTDLAEVDLTPHRVERQIQQILASQPGMTVSSLVVRRLANSNGVCLSGVIESMDDRTDVCGLVKKLAGIDDVVNRLLVRSSSGE